MPVWLATWNFVGPLAQVQSQHNEADLYHPEFESVGRSNWYHHPSRRHAEKMINSCNWRWASEGGAEYASKQAYLDVHCFIVPHARRRRDILPRRRQVLRNVAERGAGASGQSSAEAAIRTLGAGGAAPAGWTLHAMEDVGHMGLKYGDPELVGKSSGYSVSSRKGARGMLLHGIEFVLACCSKMIMLMRACRSGDGLTFA